MSRSVSTGLRSGSGGTGIRAGSRGSGVSPSGGGALEGDSPHLLYIDGASYNGPRLAISGRKGHWHHSPFLGVAETATVGPYGMAFDPASGRIVAGSSNGIVGLSEDLGYTWRRAVDIAPDIESVTWVADLGLFIAGTGNSRVYTSPDGATWTDRGQIYAVSTNNVSCIVWSPELGLLVAVGGAGSIATSPDGTTWTDRTAGSDTVQDLASVTWGSTAGVFVAVGGGETVTVSSDGTTWSATTDAGLAGTQSIRHVAWSPSLEVFCVLALDGSTSLTQDGVIFTDPGNIGSVNPDGLVWVEQESRFIAVAGSEAYESADGVTWGRDRSFAIQDARAILAVPAVASVQMHPRSYASTNFWTTSSVGAQVIEMPEGSTSGDLIFVAMCVDGSTAASASSGWTKIGTSTIADPTTAVFDLFARVLDGSGDDQPTITGNTSDGSWFAWRIPASEHSVADVSTDIDINSENFTTATNQPTSPALDAGSTASRRWFSIFGWDFDVSTTLAALPVGYQLLIDQRPISGLGDYGSIMVAVREDENQIESPTPWELEDAEKGVAFTVGVPVSTTPIPYPNQELVSVVESFNYDDGSLESVAPDWTVREGSFEIVSNRLRCTSSSAAHAILDTPELATTANRVQAEVYGAGSVNIGVALRCRPDRRDAIVAYWDGGSDQWEMASYVADVREWLDVAAGPSSATGEVIRLEVIDFTARMFVDDVLIHERRLQDYDTASPAFRQVGVWSDSASGGEIAALEAQDLPPNT